MQTPDDTTDPFTAELLNAAGSPQLIDALAHLYPFDDARELAQQALRTAALIIAATQHAEEEPPLWAPAGGATAEDVLHFECLAYAAPSVAMFCSKMPRIEDSQTAMLVSAGALLSAALLPAFAAGIVVQGLSATMPALPGGGAQNG